MGLRLRPRDPSKFQVGNAILYGGDRKLEFDDKLSVIDNEVFYVETDFGNHMTLTWREVEEMFTIAGWQSYEDWKAARRALQSQPNLIQLKFREELERHEHVSA